MAKHLLLPVLTLSFFLSSSGLAQVINTTVPPLNGGQTEVGITFNLQVQDSISISRIAMSFVNSGMNNYFIWKRNGAINGQPNISLINGWIPVQIDVHDVQQAGPGTLEYIDLLTPHILAPGIYGFYVGGGPFYISDTSVGAPFTYGDTITTITTGPNVGYAGPQPTPMITPVQFNGAIDYLPLNITCSLPSNITSTFLGATNHLIDWTENGSSTAWQIEWGPLGFQLGSGTRINTTTKPQVISGLASGPSYEVYVRSVCAPGDTSHWYYPYLLRTEYCQPTQQYHGNAEITNVVVTGENIGITNLQTCPGAIGVQDFTKTQVSDILPGNSYMASITFGTCSFVNTASGEAWVDWNNNFVFEPNESIGNWSGMTEPSGSLAYNATFLFTVPPGTLPGYKRLRIMSVSGVNVPLLDPCLSGNYDGSIEEYSVLVLDSNTSCAVPTAPFADLIGVHSARLNWTDNRPSAQWEIEYGVPGFIPGSGSKAIANTNPFVLSGLNSKQYYEFRVRSICGSDTSYHSHEASFLTDCDKLTAPHFDDFNGIWWGEDDTSGLAINSEIDPCWSRISVDPRDFTWKVRTGNYPFTQFSGPASDKSGKGKYVFASPQSFSLSFASLYTPIFDLSGLANPTLEYWYHLHGRDISRLDLEADTGSGWFSIDSLIGPQQFRNSDPWRNRRIALDPVNSIQFRYVAYNDNGFNYVAIDDFSIGENPSCPEPFDLIPDYITSDSATILWSDSGTASLWQIEFGPNGFLPGTGTTSTSTLPRALIQGLNPNSDYHVYVRSICGTGDSSIYSIPLSFSTPCTPLSTPWHESMDGNIWIPTQYSFVDSSQIDSCWSVFPSSVEQYRWRTGVDTTLTSQTGPLADYSDTGNYVYTEASNGFRGEVTRLQTPVLNVSALNQPLLEFWYHFFGDDIDKFYIETRSNGKWIVLDSIVGSQQTLEPDPWLRKRYELTASNTTAIQFKAVRGNGQRGDLAIDEVSVYESPGCLEPDYPILISSTNDSATISWSQSGSASVWVIEYDTQGFIPGSGMSQLVTSNPAKIGSLIPGTFYDAYIRAICGPGDTSLYSEPLTFGLTCQVFSAPYFESLDGLNWIPDNSITASNSTSDPCWNRDPNLPGQYMWHVQSDGYPFGVTGPIVDASDTGNYIYLDGQIIGDTGILYMPAIDISGLNNPALEFRYFFHGFQIDRMYVEQEVNGSWIRIDSIVGEKQFVKVEPWKLKYSSLQKTGIANIRFTGIRGSGPNCDMALDEFRLTEMPTCIEPDWIGGQMNDYNSIFIGWDTGASQALWEVEYGLAGFANGSGNKKLVTGQSDIITGLIFDNEYDFTIRRVCGAGDTSRYAKRVKIPLDYCDNGPKFPGDAEITNVELIGDQYSISNLNTCPGDLGVQDFSKLDSADLSLGATYSVNITFGSCAPTTLNNNCAAWIDWNRDGFYDQSESIGLWNGAPAPPGTSSFNANFTFTVPGNAHIGATQIRILMETINSSSPIFACQEVAFGSIEEYRAVIHPPIANLGPDQLVGGCETVILDPGAFDSYSWSTGDTTPTLSLDGNILPPGSYTYSVSVEDSVGRMSNDTVTVTFVPKPVVSLSATDTITVSGGATSFSLDAGPSFAGYLWDDGTTQQTRVVMLDGSYWVEVMDSLQCTASDTVYVRFILSTDEPTLGIVQLYPIPVRDVLYVQCSQALEAKELRLELYSLTGTLLISKETVTSTTALEQLFMKGLPSGTYILLIRTTKETFRRTIQKL
jgi:hypothetical protein